MLSTIQREKAIASSQVEEARKVSLRSSDRVHLTMFLLQFFVFLLAPVS